MYFGDFQNWPGVHHATSPDNINYTYAQKLLNDGVIVNDMKKFTVSGAPCYIWGYHTNGHRIYYSLGPNPSNAGIGVRTLFLNKGAPDRYIVSCGFVQDGNKLIGCLFGAVSSLDQNRIFARWLQRMTLFSNASVRWSDTEESVGPDGTRVYMTQVRMSKRVKSKSSPKTAQLSNIPARFSRFLPEIFGNRAIESCEQGRWESFRCVCHEMLTSFLELQRAIHGFAVSLV